MFINQSYYSEVDFNQSDVCQMSERFVQYYRDLMNRYQLQQNLNTFEVNYIGLDKLLSLVAKQKTILPDLRAADLILRPVWMAYINSDYCSEGLRVKDKLSLSANLIDIGNAGNLCCYTALALADVYLKSEISSSVAVLCLESAVAQLFMEKNMTYGEINFIGMMSLGSQAKKHGIEVVRVLFDNDPVNLIAEFKNTVGNCLEKNLQVICRNCADITAVFEPTLMQFKKVNLNKISYGMSSGFLLHCLNKLILKEKNYPKQNYLIVDVDVESKNLAGVLVRV